MTLLLAEKNIAGTWDIEFYDGKALPIDDPKNIDAYRIYQQFSPSSTSSFKQLTTSFQFDSHNCGAFTCWILQKRLEGLSFEAIASKYS